MENMLFEFAKTIIGENLDVVEKQVKCKDVTLTLLFYKSMIKEDYLIYGILKPILDYENGKDSENPTLDNLKNQIISTGIIEKLEDEQSVKKAITQNKILIFSNNQTDACLSVDIVDYPARLPQEPPTSAVLKGPREGFVEDIRTNITLIRRRLATDKLVLKELSVGKYTQTKVVISYIEGIASKAVVCSIKSRLEKINIDGVIDAYYLINFLEDKRFSVFKQVGSTEKPDIVVGKMLEGRVAIIVDNSPIVLTLPFLYMEDIQSSNDYYTNNFYATFIRFIRLFGIFMSIIVPGFYLALRFYHYNLVPFKFLVTIDNATQTIPLTPFLEIVFLLILFQLLYEVSLRLPQYLGLATSIVGALILGDTGVKAGLISPPGVLVIALSIISIYTVPDQEGQLNLLRAVFILLGGGFGLFGIVSGVVFTVGYLNSLNNYGAPYLAPLSPLVRSDLKDAFYKSNITKMVDRPRSFKNKNKVRLKK